MLPSSDISLENNSSTPLASWRWLSIQVAFSMLRAALLTNCGSMVSVMKNSLRPPWAVTSMLPMA
ncbi:hypothetical protein D3C81_1951490 [compost metagenome]